jgi:broad specificity phosphatase PhoE
MKLRRSVLLVLCGFGAVAAARAQPAASAIVVLVRHAEKAAAPADDPGLTDAGRARADALAEALRDAHVDAIITTQYARTRNTAAPLARAQQVTPILVETGADSAAHVREVAAAIRRQPAGRLVVIVGHSNTIPGIITALGGPRLPDLCDGEFSDLFTLVLPHEGQPRLIQSRYGARDAEKPCDREMIR